MFGVLRPGVSDLETLCSSHEQTNEAIITPTFCNIEFKPLQLQWSVSASALRLRVQASTSIKVTEEVQPLGGATCAGARVNEKNKIQ